MLFTFDIFCEMELIKILLIDNDLSESTFIVFLNGAILEFKNTLNF